MFSLTEWVEKAKEFRKSADNAGIPLTEAVWHIEGLCWSKVLYRSKLVEIGISKWMADRYVAIWRLHYRNVSKQSLYDVGMKKLGMLYKKRIFDRTNPEIHDWIKLAKVETVHGLKVRLYHETKKQKKMEFLGGTDVQMMWRRCLIHKGAVVFGNGLKNKNPAACAMLTDLHALYFPNG